jgi:hypothetical protein
MEKILIAPSIALLMLLILSISPACSMPTDRESREDPKGRVAKTMEKDLDATGKELAIKGAKGIEKILNKASVILQLRFS